MALDRPEENSLATVVSVGTTLAGDDEFGQVADGSLILNTPLRGGLYWGNVERAKKKARVVPGKGGTFCRLAMIPGTMFITCLKKLKRGTK